MSNELDFSEGELHAYLDGELDAARADAVAARLAADPELASKVAGFRADMAMILQIYGPLSRKPVPDKWLALMENAGPASHVSWRGWATAIAAALLIALAAATPFVYRTFETSQPSEIVAAALAARQAPAGKTIAVADNTVGQYDGTVSSVIAEHVKVPDLGKMGYRLSAIRLYPAAPGGSAAELTYRDRDNRLFTLYLRRSDGTARFDQFERAGLRVCIWQDDQLGMVMAGNVTTAAMQRLASLAYTGLTL
jgi:anti-sigma factor RsiW